MPPVITEEPKRRVRTFWERYPCGAKHAKAEEGTPEYFRQVEESRDRLEPFIANYARFSEQAGREVLEIGVGLGSDFIRFCRAGARATGVDITERAIALVRRRLEVERLGAELQVADAESLPFRDASFDFVYSWGVLHHTPDSEGAIREAMRVLRPGGEFCIMLYARRSWVGVGLWVRYALLAGRPRRTISYVIANHMESEGTRAYTPLELKRLFVGMENLQVEQVATPYDGRVAGPLARVTGRWMGWFAVIRGRKPI